MDKLLLLMPSFMGYEMALIKELEKKYLVTFVDSDSYMRQIRDCYYSNKINRLARKLCAPLRLLEQEIVLGNFQKFQLSQIDFSLNAYDVIFTINGHGLTNEVYRQLVNNNKMARFILYLWDDTTNLFKTSHIELFCEKWSYNIDDCKQFDMNYLPMFVRETHLETEKNRKYDIAIVATAHSDRVEFAKKLYNRYNSILNIFIYFYDPKGECDFYSHKQPLTYGEYIEILKESKTVIDIPNIIQSGPTTRVTDAMSTKTKVISTNDELKRYPLYNANISFVDRNNPVLNLDFIDLPYLEDESTFYTLNAWLEKMNI